MADQGTPGASPRRETVLDRVVHIQDEIILDIPEIPPLCDLIPGLAKRRVDVGGCTLYREQEGGGTPLALVSGGPGCTHHHFHPWFSSAAAFARVIYYDQRGVGQSDLDETRATYTIKQAVEDLGSFRQALGIDRWVVLGHSYGGLLAQCYALEYPERVLGMVLVCASTGVPPDAIASGLTSCQLPPYDRVTSCFASLQRCATGVFPLY